MTDTGEPAVAVAPADPVAAVDVDALLEEDPELPQAVARPARTAQMRMGTDVRLTGASSRRREHNPTGGLGTGPADAATATFRYLAIPEGLIVTN
jgi:hypothetical protein